MTTVAANASSTINLAAGAAVLFGPGSSGVAMLGPGPSAGTPVAIGQGARVGPFDWARAIYVSAGASGANYTLTPEAGPAPDFVVDSSAGIPSLAATGINVGIVRLDASTSFLLPSGELDVVSRYDLLVKQGAVGGMVPTFPANVQWSGGAEPQPPLQASDASSYQFWSDGAGTVQGARLSSAIAALGYDRFQRADSAVTLGSATIGGAWTAHTGTWGISGLSAYCAVRAGDSVASVAVGAADHTVHCDVTPNNVGAQPGVVGRVVDANNYWLALPSAPNASPTLTLFKRVAGSYTSVGDTAMPAGSFAVGQPVRLSLKFVGNAITVFVDGVQKITATDADLNTAVRAGLRTNDALASAWNDFVVVAS